MTCETDRKWTILGTPQKRGTISQKGKTCLHKPIIFLQMCLLSVYLLANCLAGEHVSCCVSILCDAITHMSKKKSSQIKSNCQSTAKSPKHSPFLFHKISSLEKVVQTSITNPYTIYHGNPQPSFFGVITHICKAKKKTFP